MGIPPQVGAASVSEGRGLMATNDPPAQTYPDVVTADPVHATLEYEDDRIRVVRLKLPAHEIVPMHHHPDRVIVNLTEVNVRITLPDGTAGESSTPAGQVGVSQEVVHQGENIGDALWEIIEVELKPQPPHRPKPTY
jgi:hypothetical protein